MRPTTEQIRTFWEWAGFRIEDGPSAPAGKVIRSRCKYPNGHRGYIPVISLNNLFKWAMPKLINDIGTMATYMLACDAMYEAIEKVNFSEKKAEYNGEPALALFWAIWEVRTLQERCNIMIPH